MWPFKRNGGSTPEKAETKIVEIDHSLQHSFHKVKNDMDHVNKWLGYLYHNDMQRNQAFENMQAQISHLSSKIDAIPASTSVPAEVTHALTKFHEFEGKVEHLKASIGSVGPLVNKIAELNSKVSLFEESQKDMKESIFNRLREFGLRIDHTEQGKPASRTTMNLREKIAKKIARHSKEYIKNIILSTIGKYDQVQALQLREMIVEEQGLCSKSTFYRLLEELEAEENVSMITRGKEKIYIPKIVRKH